jgi:hypothetical protein
MGMLARTASSRTARSKPKPSSCGIMTSASRVPAAEPCCPQRLTAVRNGMHLIFSGQQVSDVFAHVGVVVGHDYQLAIVGCFSPRQRGRCRVGKRRYIDRAPLVRGWSCRCPAHQLRTQFAGPLARRFQAWSAGRSERHLFRQAFRVVPWPCYRV